MNKNKGFSLVELIVVVAIMAVLVAILAPAYLSYVEKTRKGTDEDMAESIRRAVENAVASDLEVYDEITEADEVTLTFTEDAKIYESVAATDYPKLQAALKDTFGEKKLDIKSKAYSGGNVVVTIISGSGAGDAVMT